MKKINKILIALIVLTTITGIQKGQAQPITILQGDIYTISAPETATNITIKDGGELRIIGPLTMNGGEIRVEDGGLLRSIAGTGASITGVNGFIGIRITPAPTNPNAASSAVYLDDITISNAQRAIYYGPDPGIPNGYTRSIHLDNVDLIDCGGFIDVNIRTDNNRDINPNSIYINDCTFRSPNNLSNQAMWIKGAGKILIKNCVFDFNGGNSIHLNGVRDVDISNNTFKNRYGQDVVDFHGVCFDVTVEGNDFLQCDVIRALIIAGGMNQNGTITNLTLGGNIYCSSQQPQYYKNILTGGPGAVINLDQTNPNIVYNCSAVAISPATPSICSGESVTLTASGSSSYTWSPSVGLNTTIGNSVVATPSVTTTYHAIRIGNNNAKIGSVTVVVNPLPAFYLGADVVLCEEDPFPAMICADNTNPGDFYNWTLNGVALSGAPISCYEPNQVGTYCLEIVNAAGCKAMDCINIKLSPLADYDPAFSVSQSCEDGQNEFSVSVSFNILATGLSQKFEVYHMVNGSPVYQGVYYAAYNTSYLFIPFPFVQTETYKIVRKVWYPNCPEEIEVKKTVRCPGGNSETEARSTAGGNVSNSQNEMISLDVYPNPNNGQFTIELYNDDSNALIVVYNLMGKIVFSRNTGGNNQKIDISEQPKGIYFVKVSIGSKVFNEKIVYQ